MNKIQKGIALLSVAALFILIWAALYAPSEWAQPIENLIRGAAEWIN